MWYVFLTVSVIAHPLSVILDDIIHLIIYELNDPTALTLTSKRFLSISRDPYVRAHYFLHRYGHMDAMYWALGRGRVLNDKVIDVRLLYFLVSISVSDAQFIRSFSDPGIKWRLRISLHYTSCHSSLLPFGKSLYQDTMGPVDTPSRLHPFHESHFFAVQ